MNTPITWHLDPTVWQRARLGQYEAEIWWTGPGPQVGWAVFALGGDYAVDALAQGTGRDEADGKAQAETRLRELAS